MEPTPPELVSMAEMLAESIHAQLIARASPRAQAHLPGVVADTGDLCGEVSGWDVLETLAIQRLQEVLPVTATNIVACQVVVGINFGPQQNHIRALVTLGA